MRKPGKFWKNTLFKGIGHLEDQIFDGSKEARTLFQRKWVNVESNVTPPISFNSHISNCMCTLCTLDWCHKSWYCIKKEIWYFPLLSFIFSKRASCFKMWCCLQEYVTYFQRNKCIKTYYPKVGVPGGQTPQTILNFPQNWVWVLENCQFCNVLEIKVNMCWKSLA